MKSLLMGVFLLGLVVLLQTPVFGQDVVKQRVERYLFSSYDMTKSGLREKERLIQIVADKLDEYVLLLDNESFRHYKSRDREFNQFLERMEAVKDLKVIQQMTEESIRSQKKLLSSVLGEGIKSIEEAQECRRILVFLQMEKELLTIKNKKLVVLLKDDFNRSKFVDTILESGKLTEQTDTKSLMVTVDLSLFVFDI